MKIIIDSNVLFSALIKDSHTRRLILEYDRQFLFPDFIFRELENHKEELLKKTGLNSSSFEQLLGIILRKVQIVPDEKIKPYKNEALRIVEQIDPDDAVFVACALAYPNSIIWSDDKALKRTGLVLTTKEITTTKYLASR